jgi:hypothetical protein
VPGLVINIGGQGEIAYAVDINNLVSPTVDPELFIHSGKVHPGRRHRVTRPQHSR